ncbi:hypothetical protein AB0F88_11035 [Streptosporangium sp. NPDC023963]|uniref:hypothetical protein n=1 Tax=Streptosporangium sp. NPDC023963 TaxID=3155608 RepID=UPI00342E2D04
MHHLKTLSTGTVHAAIDGRPACPTRAKTATAYSDTTDAVTCGHCLKLAPAEVAEVDIIALTDDQLDGIACIRCHRTDTPMIPAGTGERGQLFECIPHGIADEPGPVSDHVLMVAMSCGMLLGLEAVDQHGYGDAETVMRRMARKELSGFDIGEMARAFRGVLSRREASDACAEDTCLMCQVLV